MRTRGIRLVGKLFSVLLCGLLTGVVVAAAAFPGVAMSGLSAKSASDSFENMPAELITPPLPQTSYLYAADGSLITTFYEENRTPVKLADVAPVMRDATVAAEDSRFRQHNGVDVQGIVRAFVRNQQAGEIQQGASTLTQQYVRNMLKYAAKNRFERERATEETVARKVREARYAVALEKTLTKDEVLEGYLNIAYFGNGGYGIGSAAQRYFSKKPAQLTLPEAALLAGLVQSPSAYNPIGGDVYPATERRNYVLQRMADLRMITQAQADAAARAPLGLRPRKAQSSCVTGNTAYGFYCDWFLDWWKSNPAFGKSRPERERNLRRGGYRIVTALDPAMQRAAQAAVDRRVSRSSNFAAGIVLVEPGTGRVKAMAINRTYSLARNRAGRNAPYTVNPLLTGTSVSPGYQAGSTFKLFTMVAALEKGLPLGTRIYAPGRIVTQFRNATGPVACAGDHWCPRNASPGMTGMHNMWTGFGESVNTFFIQLEERITVKAAVSMAERMGIRLRDGTDVRLRNAAMRDPRGGQWGAFTIGVALVSPLDLANAYATVAARGKRCDPLPLLSLTDRNGARMPAANPRCRQVIAPDVADAAADAARCPVGEPASSACSVANGVTAGRVGAAFRRPMAGKSGTTDANKAAWFVGFTPNLAAAAFYADPDNPNKRPVPTYRIPASVYIDTMLTALRKVPVRGFVPPTRYRMYGATGVPPTLRSDPGFEPWPKKEEPEVRPPRTPRPPSTPATPATPPPPRPRP